MVVYILLVGDRRYSLWGRLISPDGTSVDEHRTYRGEGPGGGGGGGAGPGGGVQPYTQDTAGSPLSSACGRDTTAAPPRYLV